MMQRRRVGQVSCALAALALALTAGAQTPQEVSAVFEGWDQGWVAGNWQVYSASTEQVKVSAATGMAWGAYAGATELIQRHDSGPKTLTFTRDANEPGDYVYSVFSSNGDATPTSCVTNMYAGEVGINTTDSTNPELARLLVRDADGDWYLASADDAIEFGSSTRCTTVSLKGFQWNKVTGAAASNMNEMNDTSNSSAITTDAQATAPNLTAVTGGGVYVQSGSSVDFFRLDYVLWMSGPDAPTFASASWSEGAAVPGSGFSGDLSDNVVFDGDTEDLTFSLVTGPAWLGVAADGTVSGTPEVGDMGLNVCTVRVEDLGGQGATAEMRVDVVEGVDSVLETWETGWAVPGWVVYNSHQEYVRIANLTGMPWGGYAGAEKLIQYHDCEMLTFTLDANEPGDYVYSIFSENGDSTPTIAPERMYCGQIGIKSHQGSDPERIRLLLRDARSDWYLASADDAIEFTSALKCTTVSLSGMGWNRVTGAAAANMNEMDDTSNSSAITTDSESVSPDFSLVTGGGVYVQTGSSDDIFRIDYMKWISGPEAPEFEYEVWGEAPATEGVAYSGGDVADNVLYDGDLADLTFSKAAGPAWLSVAMDGSLSGTPGAGDVGLNTFTVRVADPGGLADTADIKILVGEGVVPCREIREGFSLGWESGGAAIYSGNTEDVKESAETGFAWGGYTSETTLIQWHEAAEGSLTWTLDANVPGDYVYTIFSENGDSAPTKKVVDMGDGEILIQFVEGSNPEWVRMLIRDANGDWYLSTAGTAMSVTPTMAYLVVGMESLAWEKVTGSAATNMNEMNDASNSAKITTDAGSTTPDLSEVTGGGVFIEDGSNEDVFRIDYIIWRSGVSDPVPQTSITESFGMGWLNGDEDVYATGTEMVRRSGQTGFWWGGYLGADDRLAWDGVDQSLAFTDDGNVAGDYAYCVFGDSPIAAPTQCVLNMDRGEVEVTVKGGSNPQTMRVLLLNDVGQWHVSSADDVLTFTPGSLTRTIRLDDVTWERVKGDAEANMLEMSDDGNSAQLETKALLNPPDLSVVVGGGLVIAGGSSAYPVEIESVTWTSGDTPPEPLTKIVETFDSGWTAGSDAVFDNQTETEKRSADTGFAWGGYAGGGSLIDWDSGAGGSLLLSGSANVPGDYVYTIFSANGDATATSCVLGMEFGQVRVRVADGSDPEEMRLLVRDRDGDWYLSTAASRISFDTYTKTATADLADMAWEKVNGSAATNLNDLAGSYNAVALTTDAGSTTPDLSELTGGGVVIATGSQADSLAIQSIAWGHGLAEDDPFVYVEYSPSSLTLPEHFEENRVQLHTRLSLSYYDKDVFTRAEEDFSSMGCRMYTRHCKTGDEGAWWPSEYGAVSPITGENDVALEMIDRAHRNNLRIIQYHRHMEDEYMAEQHPDWVCVDENGTSPTARGYYLCLNSPYLDYFTSRTLELAERGVDGFYYDERHMPLEGCWCPHCRARFTAETGLAHPEAVDWNDPDYRALVQFNNETIHRGFTHYRDAVHAVRPGLPMLFSCWLPRVHLPYHGSAFARLAPTTKSEYEMAVRNGDVQGFWRNVSTTLPRPEFDVVLAFAWVLQRDAGQCRPGHYWFNDSRSSEEMLASSAGMMAYGHINNLDINENTIPDSMFSPALEFGRDNSKHVAFTRPVRWAGIHFSETARNNRYADDIDDREPMYADIFVPMYEAFETLCRKRAPVSVVTDTQLELGELGGLEAIILPITDDLTTQQLASLQSFQNAGGVVIAMDNDPRWTESEASQEEARADLWQELVNRLGPPPVSMTGGAKEVHAVAVELPGDTNRVRVCVTNDFTWMGKLEGMHLDGTVNEGPGTPPASVSNAVVHLSGVRPSKVVELVGGTELTATITEDGCDIALPTFDWLAVVDVVYGDVELHTSLVEDFEHGLTQAIHYNEAEYVRVCDSTGIAWGGYCPAGWSTQTKVQYHAAGQMNFAGIAGGHEPGAYVYGIFGDGDGKATSGVLDMDDGTIRVQGSVDSGTDYLRALIRDARGDWYLSTTDTAISWTSTVAWKSFVMRDMTWEKVTGAAAANMNQMDNRGDSAPITTDGGATTPDLSHITGGGLYLHSCTAPDTAAYRTHEIQWLSNRAPSFTADPIVLANQAEESSIGGSLSAYVSDDDEGDTFTYSKQYGPSWLTVAADGSLSGAPDDADLGLNTFQVRARDAAGEVADTTLEITVTNVNDDPEFDEDPIVFPDAWVAWPCKGTLAGLASDVDAGEVLSYSKTGGPAWLGVASDGTLSGVPAESDKGLNEFTVRVTDDESAYDEATLRITVTDGPEAAPEISEGFSGGSFVGGVTAVYDSDREYIRQSKETGFGWGAYADADSLVQWHADPDEGLTFTVDANEPGDYCYTIFSENGDDIFTTHVQAMYLGEVEIYKAGGSNPETVRLLIRDKNGDWYLSDSGSTMDLTGGTLSVNASLKNFGWEKVTGAAASNMDEMSDDSDSTAISTDPGATSPDLTAVTGGGVYIHQGSDANVFRIGTVTWRSGPAPPAFESDPVVQADAAEDTAYSRTLADNVVYSGAEALAYRKIGGPAWLSVASDGALSGTPAAGDIGLNTFRVEVTDFGGVGEEADLRITVLNTNDPPVFTLSTITRPDAVEDEAYTGQTLSGEATDEDPGDTLTYAKVSGPDWLTVAANGALGGTPGNGDVGLNLFVVSATDSQSASDEADLEIDVENRDFMEGGVALVDAYPDWTTVTLAKTYNSPVVVCVVNADNNTIPVVARVRDAAGNSFLATLTNPSESSAVSDDIHYLVVEEGAWELPNGTAIEARLTSSTVTDRKGSWSGQSLGYLNSYTNPIVLGQVMTFNDPIWSAFWCRGSAQGAPPDSSYLYVGKHVGEDNDTFRYDDLLGVIVVESFGGTVDGVPVAVALGSDTVQGMTNSPPYNYSLSGFSATPEVAVVTQAAMDGGDGAWACLYGSTPLSQTAVSLVVDEDQCGDSERGHTTEQLGYFIMQSEGVFRLYQP